MHVNVRIEPRWTFTEVRRAAIALSRAVERRAPAIASSKWWKEERHGVFLDYNQNAKDRTTCSAYSVRPLPDARVSTPLTWQEVPDCDPAGFTVLTVPKRFAEIGDPHAGHGRGAGFARKLAELAAKDEAEGLGDAPWPPHFRKMEGRSAARGAFPCQVRREAASDENAAPHSCKFTREGSCAGWPRKVEGEACRSRQISRRRRRTGRFHARLVIHMDSNPGEPAQCAGSACVRRRRLPTRTTIQRASGVRSTSQRSVPQRRALKRVMPGQRPVEKIAANSCGATTSSCA